MKKIVASLLVASCMFMVTPAFADHDYYECMDHEYCDGGYYEDGDYEEGDYEDNRGSRNGRDKRVCFFGCDNIIVIPGLPGMGGGEEGREPQ